MWLIKPCFAKERFFLDTLYIVFVFVFNSVVFNLRGHAAAMEGFLINLSIQVWRPDRKVSSVEHQLVLQQYYPDTTSITQAPPVLPRHHQYYPDTTSITQTPPVLPRHHQYYQ